MNADSLRENIEKYGWQCQFVFDPEGENPSFSYSIGFEESYGHPEIMIFGLKREVMHSLLNDLAKEIEAGRVFEPNEKIGGLVAGEFDVLFKPIKESFITEYAGIASRYYERPINMLIMFWPDKNNILPTDSSCELSVQNEALEIV